MLSRAEFFCLLLLSCLINILLVNAQPQQHQQQQPQFSNYSLTIVNNDVTCAVYLDTILLGNQNDSPFSTSHAGSVSPFRFNRSTSSWMTDPIITAPDYTPFVYFGSSVVVFNSSAPGGLTAAVGAVLKSFNSSLTSTGAVYIFQQNASDPSQWVYSTTLFAPDMVAGDSMGNSITAGPDLIVAGSPNHNSYTGEAHIYWRDQGGPGVWGYNKTVIANGTTSTGMKFGISVALDGDHLLIGAPGSSPASFGGQAFLFYRHLGGPGVFGLLVELTDPLNVNNDMFGFAVAISGDNLIIGAPQGTSAGIAQHFNRLNGGADNWGLQSTITFTGTPTGGDRFGTTLAMKGNLSVVAAYYTPSFSQVGEASLYGLNSSGTGYKLLQYIPDPNGFTGDSFGLAVAMGDLWTLIGGVNQMLIVYQTPASPSPSPPVPSPPTPHGPFFVVFLVILAIGVLIGGAIVFLGSSHPEWLAPEAIFKGYDSHSSS